MAIRDLSASEIDAVAAGARLNFSRVNIQQNYASIVMRGNTANTSGNGSSNAGGLYASIVQSNQNNGSFNNR